MVIAVGEGDSVPEFCPPETPQSAGPDDSRGDVESQDERRFEGLEQVADFPSSLGARNQVRFRVMHSCPALTRLIDCTHWV